MPDQARALEEPRMLETVGMNHPDGIWYAVTTAARNEYLPRSVHMAPTAHPDAPGRIRGERDLGPPAQQLGAWRRWVADVGVGGTYEVAWFAFPGLRATRNDEPLELVSGGTRGLVQFELPAGRQVVDVWYERPPEQAAGSGATALGLLLVLGLVVRDRRAATP